MSDKKKEPIIFTVVGILAGAFLIDFALVKFGTKPYLYCELKDLVWGIYGPFQIWFSLTGIGIMIFGMIVFRPKLIVFGIAVMLGAYLLPMWGRIIFSVGGEC